MVLLLGFTVLCRTFGRRTCAKVTQPDRILSRYVELELKAHPTTVFAAWAEWSFHEHWANQVQRTAAAIL